MVLPTGCPHSVGLLAGVCRTESQSPHYTPGLGGGGGYRHVKCNGSSVSLTEKGPVFHKTDFLKKSKIFEKKLLCSKDFRKSRFCSRKTSIKVLRVIFV